MKIPFLLGFAAFVGLATAGSLHAQAVDPAASPASATATPVDAATNASADAPKAAARRPSPKMLEKYDTNKNGVLDPEEKAARKKDRAARKAERLKKYDKNNNGKLDESEKAAMKADKKSAKGQ